MVIVKPKWREVREVRDLHVELGSGTEEYAGNSGVIFVAERGSCYAYLAEIDGKVKYVVPIERDEYAFDTVDEAARCHQLMEFAIGEGMFPSFRQSIANAIQDWIEQSLAPEVMLDRESGDIAPEQDQIEHDAIVEIASVLEAVWAQNRPRS